jgi:hypothetical protein
MEPNESLFSATAFRRIDQKTVKLGRFIRVPERITYSRLLKQNCICMSSTMIHRSLIQTVRFKETGCEDFAFWLDILRAPADCRGINQDLVRYRIHPKSRGASKWKTAMESWQILVSQPNVGILRALRHYAELLLRGFIKYSRF